MIMQDPNIPTGVYEQIINRLFNLKLSRMDAERFYIGKKQISKDDAVHILSKYLQRLIEVAFVGVPDDQEVGKYTDFVNSVIKTLGREFDVDDTELDLIDAQKSILTAVIDRTNCEYPDIEKHLPGHYARHLAEPQCLVFRRQGACRHGERIKPRDSLL